MALIQPPYWPMDGTHREGNVLVPAYIFIVYVVAIAALRYGTGRKTENNSMADIIGEALACVGHELSSPCAILLTRFTQAFLIASFVFDHKGVQAGLGSPQASLSDSEVDEVFKVSQNAT